MARSPEGAEGKAVGGDGARRWPFWVAVAVLAVGLLVTAALTLVSSGAYARNEKRLLELRAKDVATALTAVLPSIQTPLASAAELADANGGNVEKFKGFAAPYIGQGGASPFVSVSLWRVSDPQRDRFAGGAASSSRLYLYEEGCWPVRCLRGERRAE